MTLDPRFICASDLELYLVDKTTGLPLVKGIVEFYSDINRSTFKPVYTISGNPPNYTFIQLPNPSELSAVGTFQDAGQNNVVPYYYPYDSDGNIELYFIVVKDQFGVEQFTREAWPPNVPDSGNVDTTAIVNYIPNGQFLIHYDVPADPLNDIPFGQVTQDTFPLGYGGWYFSRSSGSTAIDNIKFFRYGQYVQNPEASPRYAFQLVTTTPGMSDLFKRLEMRFSDVNKFASDNVAYTFMFTGITFSSGNFPIDLVLIKDFGTGGSPSPRQEITIASFTIINSETKFTTSFQFGDNDGTTVGTNNDDYVSLALSYPTGISNGSLVTDFALYPGMITNPSFSQTTDFDFISRSLAVHVPTPDGSTLYLPIVEKKVGYVTDDSSIGNVEARTYSLSDFVDSVNQFSNLLLADGAQYYTDGYSLLGIPFSRLQKKYFDNTLGIPIYGTGRNFVSTAILTATDHLFIGTNEFGDAAIPVDFNTGFTFFEVKEFSELGYGLEGYKTGDVENPVQCIANLGAVNDPTAGTSGFTITIRKGGAFGDIKLTFFIKTIAATTLAGKYFTFQTFPGPTSYYMWFTVDGVGSDPAPGGTGIKVNLKSTYTADDVGNIISFALSGKQVEVITTKAANLLTAGCYWRFGTTDGGVYPIDYYVWYTIDGMGDDPAPTDAFGIKVELLSTDTAVQVATKTKFAINRVYFATPDFRGLFLRGYDINNKWDLDSFLRFSQVPGVNGNTIGTQELDTFFIHRHGAQAQVEHNNVYQAGGEPAFNTSGFTAFEGQSETRSVNTSVNWVIRY